MLHSHDEKHGVEAQGYWFSTISISIIHLRCFGKHTGGTYEVGLVFSPDSFEFNSHLANCQNVWNTREKQYKDPGQFFFNY